MSESTMGTGSLNLDSSDETALKVASDYFSWLTRVEPYVVFYYSTSASRIDQLCILSCISAHPGCKEWLCKLP